MNKKAVIIINLILLITFSFISFDKFDKTINIYSFTTLPFLEINFLNLNIVDTAPSLLFRTLFYLIIYIFFIFYIPNSILYEIYKEKELSEIVLFTYPIVYIVVSSIGMNGLYLYFYIFNKII